VTNPASSLSRKLSRLFVNGLHPKAGDAQTHAGEGQLITFAHRCQENKVGIGLCVEPAASGDFFFQLAGAPAGIAQAEEVVSLVPEELLE
jgi:hypothetical protein